MQIPCNYEINVATAPEKGAAYGRHYCTIELGDCLEDTAIKRFMQIRGFFPSKYKLTLHRIECYGREVM